MGGLSVHQAGGHLPDEDLRAGWAGGDALAAGGGQPGGVAGVQRAGAFQIHRAAGDEQVHERGSR